MPFELERFMIKRPMCVHRTHRDNVSGIKTRAEIWPASDLYRNAGCHRPTVRRRSMGQDLSLCCSWGRLRLNDQDPFDERFGIFDDGMTPSEFPAALDERVFFWPLARDLQSETAASSKLASAFLAKYAESSMLLVVPTRDLIAQNPQLEPQFSRCNSGTLSSRTKLFNRRGRNTFLTADRFIGTLSDVKEVVFRGRVRLPPSMCIRSPRGR